MHADFRNAFNSDDPEAEFQPARRQRSQGVLTGAELRKYRADGVQLAYDALQTGWVTACCVDDLSETQPDDDHIWAEGPAMSQGLRLRAWARSDADRFLELLGDPDLWRFMPEARPEPFDRTVAEALIEVSNASNHHKVRAIEMQGRIVGQVRLKFDDTGQAEDTAEVSYWLGRSYWGQGIGTEAMRSFSAMVFRDHPDLRRLFARVHCDNAASLRLLAKVGFENKRPDPADPAWCLVDLRRWRA